MDLWQIIALGIFVVLVGWALWVDRFALWWGGGDGRGDGASD